MGAFVYGKAMDNAPILAIGKCIDIFVRVPNKETLESLPGMISHEQHPHITWGLAFEADEVYSTVIIH